MLNIDWFNPYKETLYSVGAIYLIVQNLPRSERFKVENIILVGLIPGPTEPSKHINTYLDPLIDDLLKLYYGIEMKDPLSTSGYTKIRAVLSCIVCDIPATRKVCGFLGCNATMGCSKCQKKIVTTSFGSKPDYSGFDLSSWTPRTHSEHHETCIKAKNAPTPTERFRIEKQHGARYSELLRLPYFDVIRYHTVDPMHNLFLGIAKNSIITWKDLNIISSANYSELQAKVDAIKPPPKLGRIPRKIGSGFSSFTADEWKNWILLYSGYALHGILPAQDYNCWLIFVKACIFICQLVITRQDAFNAHKLILQYCKTFEQLYGSDRCTPNMHMACHIYDCILDYGPLAAFWAFSFERYNGILENLKLSWCGPEKQMLKKFIDIQSIHYLKASSDPFFDMVYSGIIHPNSSFTSIDQMAFQTDFLSKQSTNFSCQVCEIDATFKSLYKLLPPIREKCFKDRDMADLNIVYSLLYPSQNFEILTLSRFYHKVNQIIINGEVFISTQSRSEQSAAVLAHWPSIRGIDTTGDAPVRIGIISSIIEHVATIKTSATDIIKTQKHVFAYVQWLQDHTRNDYFKSPCIISSSIFDDEGPANVVPVSRLIARCAIVHDLLCEFDYGEDRICVSIPLFKKVL